METTETTQPSLDGIGVSNGFSNSGDFVMVTDEAPGATATINERWYRLYSHSKAMCELMVAFNAELEPGYAPQGLGIAVHDQLAKLENLATAARILITPAIAATGEWKRDGAPNPERWFAGKTGKSPATARAEMETGKNLGNAPGTRKAFLEGEISAAQADTISDVADVNPEAEQALLDAAKKQSLKELKDEAARRKAEVEDMEKREKRIHKKRYLRTWTDSEGAWNLHAKGTIPDGADFQSVLERLIDQQFKQARKNGVRGTRDNYAFDALMNMGAQHGMGGFGDPCASGFRPSDSGPTDSGPTDLGPINPSPPNPGASGPQPGDPGPAGIGPTSPGATRRGPKGTSAAKPGPTAAQAPQPGAPSKDVTTKRRSRRQPRQASNDSPPARSTNCGEPSPEPVPADGRSGEQTLSLFPGVVDPLDLNGGDRRQSLGTQRSSRPLGQRLTYCIDWEALIRGQARIGERCELRGTGPVSVSSVRRALANGSAKLIVTDAGDRAVTVAHLGTGPINLRLIPGLLDPTRRDLEGFCQPSAGGADATPSGGAVGTTVIIRVRADSLQAGATSGDRPDGRDRYAPCAPGDPTDTEPVDRIGEPDEGSLEAARPAAAIPGVGRVSRAAAAATLGRDVLARLASRGVAVRNLTYAGRAPNAAQRVALAWAGTTCKVEACPNQRIEIDHRRPWAANRVTELENLDPLCSHHHDLKSCEGWQFVAGTNRFVPPEDSDHPGHRDRSGPVARDGAAGQ